MKKENKITAVILAGGELKDSVSQPGKVKGLVEVAGKPMIEYIIIALEGCPSIKKILAILPSSVKERDFNKGKSELFYADRDFIDNLHQGVNNLNLEREDLVLAVSTDIPLITSTGLDNFIQKCLEKGGDGFYPIMTKEKILARFPTTKRTYVPLKDGAICGGNLLLVKKMVIDDSIEYVQKLYEKRKSTIGMLRVIGLWYLLKFIFRSLYVADLEKRASYLVGADLKGVRTDYVELAIDVDKDEDLYLVEKTLKGRKTG